MDSELLMIVASADPFRVVASDRFHQHDDQECVGAEYETREERSERRYREHTEHLLIESAERMDADLLRMDAEDRRYREAHPDPISSESLRIAAEYMAKHAPKEE
jgi:hypothetical protein